MSKKAIFFDRDDTLLIDWGYMYKVEDLVFISDTFSVLKELQDKDYLLFIVTNQSGIGRGFFQESDMHKFHEAMLKELTAEGIKIQEIVFCPHSPEDKCDCRKPSPRLLNELCEKYDIDKSLSYMVGDKQSDVDAGKSADLKTFNVKHNSLTNFFNNLN